MSSFEIEVQNSAGAKVQVESRYLVAYNITVIQLPSSSSAATAVCEFLHAARSLRPAPGRREAHPYCDIGDGITFLIFMTAGSLGSTR
jgi:hypothetical protein